VSACARFIHYIGWLKKNFPNFKVQHFLSGLFNSLRCVHMNTVCVYLIIPLATKLGRYCDLFNGQTLLKVIPLLRNCYILSGHLLPIYLADFNHIWYTSSVSKVVVHMRFISRSDPLIPFYLYWCHLFSTCHLFSFLPWSQGLVRLAPINSFSTNLKISTGLLD
jgi:hypothetical protein